MKLFGPLTRRSYEWHPVSLLCKRFDVPDPYPKSGLVGVVGLPTGGLQRFSASAPTSSSGGMGTASGSGGGGRGGELVHVRPEDYGISADAMDTTLSMREVVPAKPHGAKGEGGTGVAEASSVGTGVQGAAAEPVVASERPPMDIFKAIFSDSSDDDSEGEDDAASAVRGTVLPAIAPTLPAPYYPDAPSAEDGVGTGVGAARVGGHEEQQTAARATTPPARRPVAVDAGPKLSLVHTYDDLTSQQAKRRAGDSSARSMPTGDVPTAVWVEKRVVESVHKGKVKKEKKKDKKKKEKKGNVLSSRLVSFFFRFFLSWRQYLTHFLSLVLIDHCVLCCAATVQSMTDLRRLHFFFTGKDRSKSKKKKKKKTKSDGASTASDSSESDGDTPTDAQLLEKVTCIP